MLLILLAYLGGVLTILSPCILPVLPFVFARADQPFARSTCLCSPAWRLPSRAWPPSQPWAAAGRRKPTRSAAPSRSSCWRSSRVTLLWPRLAERLSHPLVNAGNRLAALAQTDGKPPGVGSSFLLGIATGLLWAPCAGPILGLLLTGAALHGANAGTTVLLVAYAAGAATSLAVAVLIGGRVFAAMKRSLGAGEWVRRGIGVAMLAGVAAIATGLDTGLLTRISSVATGGLEQRLVDRLLPAHAMPADAHPGALIRTAQVAGRCRRAPRIFRWKARFPR